MTATTTLEMARPVSAPPASRIRLALLVAAVLMVATPGLLIAMPPLLDYPNHYVRLWLLSGGAERAPLSQMYAVDWNSAWTNVGMDFIGFTVGRIIPVQVLGPLLVAAATSLPPLGAALLHRRVFGGWRWWQVGMPLAAFATTLLAGLINYQIGIGLALIAASLDPLIERRLPAAGFLAVRVLMATGLLFMHVFALAFYAVLLGALALGPRLPSLRDGAALRAVGLRLVAAAAAVFIPLAAYRLTAPELPGGGVLAPIWSPWTLKYKLNLLACAFGTYDLRIDGLFMGALALIAGAALARRALGVHQGLAMCAAGLTAVALVAPTWLADTAWIDERLPIMALLTALAAVDPRFAGGGRRALAAGAVLLALVAARTAWIGDIWNDRQSDYRSIQRALSHVPAGASVMPLEHRPSVRGMREAPPGRYFHFGAGFFHQYTLAVVERHAFSPLVFAAPGKQPLKLLAPWVELSAPNGGRAPTFWVLRNRPADWVRSQPYVRDWRNRFDYALMLNADVLERVDPPPPGLKLVDDEGYARLYRVYPEGKAATKKARPPEGGRA